MNKKQKTNRLRIIITAVLLIGLYIVFKSGLILPEDFLNPWLERAVFIVPYIIIAYDILIKSVKGILKGQLLDENFLMGVASIGAFVLGECVEGVAVVLFYQIGELFESYAVGKSRKNITELMDITEDVCFVVEGDDVVKTDSDEVEIGTIIEVKPGDKIPLDGVVVEGGSVIDTSALTGESKPRDITTGDEVLSGSINVTSVIRIKTTAEFEESTASKILDMVSSAGMRKSRSENFISKFAHYYTPIVCGLAVVIAIVVPLVSGLLLGHDYNFAVWVYRALTFLVISCPCALVISVPLSFFAGIGSASAKGVLIKGSNYIEMLSKVDAVYFDKTGTLTKGEFKVTNVYSVTEDINVDLTLDNSDSAQYGSAVRELYKYAASAEYYTNHPIGISMINSYINMENANAKSDELTDAKKDEYLIKPSHVDQIGGKGIIAKVADKEVAVGNDLLMEELINGDFKKATEVGTVVYVSIDNTFAGYIVVNDQIKEGSFEAISELYKVGIKDVGMFTGDEEPIARDIAAKLGLNKIKAKLLPIDKVKALEDEINAGHKVSFIGDGINDAPVIMRSDVGIAMGALGSDAAIEASDIVIMDDDPRKVSLTVRIAKKCMRIVYENIYFSIGIKVLVLLLSLFGLASMWMAIFADVGVMILAVLNAIRCLRIK
ncbi:MAG: heavy metal translocating P-type ATPase [Lachnospiraceae bacterium]|nr:heavy metal translocating P-type ATPase [Lachnospiraceae bacterium]